MKKIMLIFGTRPEAIKMAPLVKVFKNKPKDFQVSVCVTAQHREMLDQVLDFFEITPNYDLNLMKKNQTLNELTARIITKIKPVFDDFQPDFVLVHGDTTTSMAVALSAFYHKISVGHVEAGLRTFDKYSPFPEEINRQITGRLSDIHFAPTLKAKQNLIQEGVSGNQIIVTGNTVIDSLLYAVDKVENYRDLSIEELREGLLDTKKKIILVTGHRRENFGKGFQNICKAIKKVALSNKDVQIIYPVHLNPNVQKPVELILQNIENVKLISPLSYPSFIWLMKKSYIILTDSGGIQEEAPSLGKPVLVMRDTTERPEAVEAGTVELVGSNKDLIVERCNILLNNKEVYNKMRESHNPYGDGKASERIVNYFISQE